MAYKFLSVELCFFVVLLCLQEGLSAEKMKVSPKNIDKKQDDDDDPDLKDVEAKNYISLTKNDPIPTNKEGNSKPKTKEDLPITRGDMKLPEDSEDVALATFQEARNEIPSKFRAKSKTSNKSTKENEDYYSSSMQERKETDKPVSKSKDSPDDKKTMTSETSSLESTYGMESNTSVEVDYTTEASNTTVNESDVLFPLWAISYTSDNWALGHFLLTAAFLGFEMLFFTLYLVIKNLCVYLVRRREVRASPMIISALLCVVFCGIYVGTQYVTGETIHFQMYK